MSKNPFDYLNSINTSKKDILEKDKDYPAFMVNRGLSYFYDTVLLANEMNVKHNLDNRLQYDFLLNVVRKKKRFSKWNKASECESINMIKEYYGYSNQRAKEALTILTESDIQELKSILDRGGKK